MKLATIAIAALLGLPLFASQTPSQPARRNVIIFVADGLRHGSVNKTDTPALWRVRTEGVHFENSHSVFPTFTTANASSIATGHQIGDTGDFSNTIWTGYAAYDTGNFGASPGTAVPFIENDRILADLDDHFGGNYLGETTLMAAARDAGYVTAAMGKLGPVVVQDAAAVALENKQFPVAPATIFVDDATGSATGVPISAQVLRDLGFGTLPFEPPTRSNGYGTTHIYNNGVAGNRNNAGTRMANVVQQRWFADTATTRLLPWMTKSGKPFALLYWSRDPDGTQHNQGDSLNALEPGINGDSSMAAVRNADANLAQILAWLDAHPAVKANTNVFVTSDHGFATVARRSIDRSRAASAAESAKHDYVNAENQVDTASGTLPVGFLAIDLALGMKTDLYDPDSRAAGGTFKRLRLDPAAATWEHAQSGNGYLAAASPKIDGSDARVIVAANGGSDLVYVPDGSADTVQRVVDLLLTLDYVGAVFVDDKYPNVAGTLPLSAINLVGASKLPRPAIVVAFKTFYLDNANLQTAVQVSDTGYQEGQGMHGGFGRDQTFNNMAAMGPDFRVGYVDPVPVGNADITPTLARLMGLRMLPNGTLTGRVLSEALKRGPTTAVPVVQTLRSTAVNGRQTLLLFQEFGGVKYLDAACRVAIGQNTCR
jgi:arylsulfatase A-like enzyme